jgi:hypothetical protein
MDKFSQIMRHVIRRAYPIQEFFYRSEIICYQIFFKVLKY